MTGENFRQVAIEVGLQTETGYPHRGNLDYISPIIDQSTGHWRFVAFSQCR